MVKAGCRLYTASLSVAFGCGFLIYSTYVTNNVQVVGERWMNASFARVHGYIPTPDSVALLWASVIASKEVGKVVGTLLIPFVAEGLGRRGGLLANNVLTLFGCTLCLFSLHLPYYCLMVARFCLGVSMICGVGLGSLFLIEVAPMSHRGRTGALIQIFRGFGGTMGMVFTLPEVLGTERLWTLALFLPAIPAFLQFIVLLFSPESPRHLLITENKVKEAKRALRFYQGSAGIDDALADLHSEKQRIKSSTDRVSCWKLVTNRAFLRPVGLTVLALTNRSLAGILPVQTYSTDMFVSTGLSHNVAAYSTVGLGVCHLVSAIAVTLTVERYGRRSLLLWGNIACLVSLSAVAAFSHISVHNGHTDLVPRLLTVGCLSAFMLVYPIVASVSNIVASELCHQKIRSTAFTIGLLSYSLVGFASTFAYPLLKRYMGLSWSYVPSIICLIATIGVYYSYLPETRGKSFESLFFEVEEVGGEDGRPLLFRECSRLPDLTDDEEDLFTPPKV